jgi:uncharacterized repeat protein (TIGR03803 family)
MTHKMVTFLAVILLASTVSATTEMSLWNFDTTNGGAGNPFANNLIFDGVNFYGVTWEGGNTAGCFNGCGTVFELSPNSHGGWNETGLYSFDPANGTDGSNPLGGLVRDRQGNLYGTTYYGGGSTNCNNGCGTVFKLTHGSSGWTETVLYTFTGSTDGNYPYSTLTIGTNGSLYGTTYGDGGTGTLGTVYQLSPTAEGWKKNTLHTFKGKPDGSYPTGAVVFDKMGRLYGTASSGGTYGYGCVYRLERHSTRWTLSVLHSFNSSDGAFPSWVSLIIDQAQNLYGTTENGGANDTGTVWELAYSATLNKYSEKVLHSFGPKGGTDGGYPWAGVTMRKEGTLYGTTSEGGTSNWGTIFVVTEAKNKKWKERVLYSFTGAQDGGQPGGDLLNGANGGLYGIADGGGAYVNGVVFEIAP